MSIGKWGNAWGEKYRSQIFFVAFWISFFSWILLAAALGCISINSTTVKSVPYFQGVITFTDNVTLASQDVNFYAGLNRLVIDDCNLGGNVCPPHSQPWSSVNCDTYFDNCNQCADASAGSVSMVIMSFVTQLPQITSDLQRSMGKNSPVIVILVLHSLL